MALKTFSATADEPQALVKLSTALGSSVESLYTFPTPAINVVSNQFELLNFTLVASKQVQYTVTVSNVTTVYSSSISSSKIANKDVLSFLATACNASWPKTAKLALDHQSGNIFIVDQAGMRPIFNASEGINVGGTNVAYLSFNASPALFSGKLVGVSHNFQRQTFTGKIFLHLFSEQNGVTNTDLYIDGLDTVVYRVAGDYSSYTIVSDSAPVNGDGSFMDGTWTVVTGQISGTGGWAVAPANPL